MKVRLYNAAYPMHLEKYYIETESKHWEGTWLHEETKLQAEKENFS